MGSNKRTFNSIKQSDAGLWTCRVTNPVAPLLTLQSRKITIQLECLTTTSINDIQICQGESIIIGNSTYILPGTYIDTLQSSIGCDSIITTIITQKPNSSFSQNIQLCEGESITIGSNTYNKDGFYVDTLVAMNGCDSFVNTFLTIFPVSFVEYAITICHGSSIAVGNKVYNQSGNYLDTLQGIHGCDSIIQTILTIRPEISFTINGPDKLCKGDQAIISTTMQGTYLWSNGQTTSSITETLETNTTYTLMLTDDFGCSASTAKSVIVVAPKIKGIPVNDTVVFCMKDTLIDPFSLLTQYDSNGTWLWNGSEISGQSFNLNAIPSGTHSLVYGFYNQLPCPDSDTSLVINVKDCRIEDCAFMVTDDSIRVNKNQVAEILLTANDILPDTFIISIISTDPDVLDDVSLDETGLFKFLPSNKFSDAAIVAYEVCTPDCSECKQAKLYITNEALKDIILTNIILPNSSGNNATLRFTKDEILEDSELYIFNRNGDKIFQMKDYDNSWNADGYPGGIYFYVLMYRGVDIKKTLTIMK
ncbi:MAG: gliding motility-associated C-terminal domain-containing protein [Saprospiraceae bacterium]